MNTFLYKSEPSSQRIRPLFRDSRDGGHSWERLFKKELDFAGNKPRLNLSPRPGSGSNGRPASGSPSPPRVGRPLLHFSGLFLPCKLLASAADLQRLGDRFVRRQPPLCAQPVLQQVGPLLQNGVAPAQAHAVRSIRKDVRFGGNAGLDQRLIKPQPLLHRNRLVVEGVIKKGGRRLFG